MHKQESHLSIMNASFRKAMASDVDAALPLIYSAGPYSFDYVFASAKHTSGLNFLRYCYLKGNGQFGYNNHFVGEFDNKVVVSGTCYSGQKLILFNLINLMRIVSFFGLKASIAVIVRGLRTEMVIKPPGWNTHYIAHVGVTPTIRGKGLGTQMMDFLTATGSKLNRKTVELDVDKINTQAHKLYLRLGFKETLITASTLKNKYGYVPDSIKMQRPI